MSNGVPACLAEPAAYAGSFSAMGGGDAGDTAIGNATVQSTGNATVQSIGNVTVQSIGAMVGDATTSGIADAQSVANSGVEDAAMQNRDCDWCTYECYELPCNGCGMRFCEACERNGRRIGRDCMCRMPPVPPGLAIQIGGIDNEWSLTSGANWRAGKAAASGEERMIQALTDVSFTKVCVDSGAGNTR